MPGADPVSSRPPFVLPLAGRNNLMLRIVSSVVLAPVALGVAYVGDYVFLGFWTAAAVIVLWEWDALVCGHDRNPVFSIGAVALLGTGLLWAVDRPVPTLILLALGLLGVASLAGKVRRLLCVAGLVYAGVLLLATAILRADKTYGFAAILFIFAIVWMTDIAAYVVGRIVGGPKLLPRVSPNKTWSGAIAGTVAGIGGGLLLADFAGVENLIAVGLVGFVLSVVAQVGDLMESALKRQFNAKDASWLIPGHGGLMDRLDGFITASAAALLIGLAHGGISAPGAGLLVW